MNSRCITIGKLCIETYRINVLVDTKKSFVKYDLLNLSYRVILRVYWFSDAWRRRENERITVYSTNPAIYIFEDEINKLPYIEKKLKSNLDIVTDEDKTNFIVNLINNDNRLFIALVEKYSSMFMKELNHNPFENTSTQERFSSREDLIEYFTRYCLKEKDCLDNINSLDDCIYSEY